MSSGVTCCGDLNRYGPERLICLNAWPIGSGAIRRCDLVGAGVAFLEEVCHFQASKAPVSSLPVAWGIKM